MTVRTAAIDNPMAVYPEVGGTGSLWLDTATATAAHAETDGAPYVHVSYCSGKMIHLDAEVNRMKSPTLRKIATVAPTS